LEALYRSSIGFWCRLTPGSWFRRRGFRGSRLATLLFFIDLVAWIRWRGDSDELGIPPGRCSTKKATSSCVVGANRGPQSSGDCEGAPLSLGVLVSSMALATAVVGDGRRHVAQRSAGLCNFLFCEVFCAKVSEQLVLWSVCVVSTYVTCCYYE
jgi:hypothetical protein